MNNLFNLTCTTILLSGALAITGCSSSSDSTPAPATPIGDISGVWAISESYSSPDAGCSGFDAYNLGVVQSGNAVTVTDGGGNIFNGTLSGNILTWSGSYPDGIGTTTASITITIGPTCTTLTGTSTWSYSEPGGFSCTGTSTATGTKISGTLSC